MGDLLKTFYSCHLTSAHIDYMRFSVTEKSTCLFMNVDKKIDIFVRVKQFLCISLPGVEEISGQQTQYRTNFVRHWGKVCKSTVMTGFLGKKACQFKIKFTNLSWHFLREFLYTECVERKTNYSKRIVQNSMQ